MLAYWPFLSLPFISDDYVQISMARLYGPMAHWGALFADSLYRCRATSLLLTYWSEQAFGMSPLLVNLTSLLLHIANSFLIFLLGAWQPIGWRISTAAAMAFAVFEGHQEAVAWYAALPELLVFGFTLGCVMCWIHWLHSGRQRAELYLGACALFILALLSKESAVITPLLLLLLSLAGDAPKGLARGELLPFMLLAAGYSLLSIAGAGQNQHYADGTFSLRATFLITLANSAARMFRVWGVAALLTLLLARTPKHPALLAGAAWIAITLLPYSFLTYMSYVPSRHTYMASLGLAVIIAVAYRGLEDSAVPIAGRTISGRHMATAAAALFVGVNCVYLWTRKFPQYVRRAQPTEALILRARQSGGPIRLKCFPYTYAVARDAMVIGARLPADQLSWEPDAPATEQQVYCDATQP
ncbi:MAG: hypothetical protein EXQ56_07650 [Acidobacteria bacterium]|nr:hypothetical protein [Acidobacteriota bacterium]